MNKDVLAKMLSGQVDQSVIQGLKKVGQTLNESYDVPSQDGGSSILDTLKPLSTKPPVKKEKQEFKIKSNFNTVSDDELEDELRMQKMQESVLENYKKHEQKIQAMKPKEVDKDELFALINGKKVKDIIQERKEKEEKMLIEQNSKTTNKISDYEDPTDLLKKSPTKNIEKHSLNENVKDIFNDEFVYNKKLEKIVKNILLDDDMKDWFKKEIKSALKEIIAENKK